MSMAEADGAYQTTDMTFATVLIMNGFHPVIEPTTRGRVKWVIDAEDWDERIEEIERDYAKGACLVEPLRFMREIRDVRQRMYAVLGVGDKPKGTRIRRAPSA